MKSKINLLLLIIAAQVIFTSSTVFGSNDYQKLFSLIDYIGGDYKFAISKGEVVNDAEYAEMIEFSESAIAIAGRLEKSDDSLTEKITSLNNKIKTKSSVQDVQDTTAEIKKYLISVFNISTSPSVKPSMSNGSILFAKNCTACHGERGNGKGVLSANFIPAPTNFKSQEISLSLSPLKVYNTLNFGLEGTAMPAFSTLTDEEKWDVAFYVLSISFPDELPSNIVNSTIPENLKDYKRLASLTNEEIRDEVEDNPLASARFLRNSYDDDSNNSDDENEYIGLTIAGLNSALEHYKKGDHKKALDSSTEAYLEGYEQVESEVSVADGKLALKIDKNMAKHRAHIKKGGSVDSLEQITNTISGDLNKASVLLSNKNTFSSAVLFTNSFSIILREALEAILIIAAIIAFLINTGSRKSIKYIHIGWICAIIAGLLTWLAARTVISISGLSRELIEGFTSLIAAAVLFYVSYWLISKIEVEKWKEFIKTKVETALNKKSFAALVIVSFLAVYREAFETVLFYQALSYQAEGNTAPLVWGLIAGIAVTGILGVIVFKLAISIPIKYFFSATSLLLYFLCFILTGKGIHEFQEAGVIGMTFINYIPRIDIIGVYPTLETLIPQSVIAAAFIFASFWIAGVSRDKERKEIAVNVSHISEELKTMYESFDHIKGHILEWRKCEEIDLEAEELDHRIHEVINHVDQLQNKLGDFYQDVARPVRTN